MPKQKEEDQQIPKLLECVGGQEASNGTNEKWQRITQTHTHLTKNTKEHIYA